jgi:hypothetical protein
MHWYDLIWIALGILIAIPMLLVRSEEINPDEVGAIYRLKWVDPFTFKYERQKIARTGIHAVIAIYQKFYRFQKKTQMTRFPRGTKEQIQRHDDTPLLPGQVYAFRAEQSAYNDAFHYRHEIPEDPESPIQYVHFTHLLAEEKAFMHEDSLQKSIVSEVRGFVAWNIGSSSDDPTNADPPDLSVFQFAENVGDMETAHTRIEGIAKSGLQDLMGPITHRNANRFKGVLQDKVKERLEVRSGEKSDPRTNAPVEKPMGINISAVEIEEISPGVRVSQALADESAAVSLGQASLTASEAAGQATRVTADANAYNIERTAEADAHKKELNAVAEAYEEVVAAEAAASSYEIKGLALSDPDNRYAAVVELTRDVADKAKFMVAGEGGIAASTALMIKGTLNAFEDVRKD